MSERRVRVGVVGAGRFAAECHVPGVQAHPRGEVVALCARNRERTAALAARLYTHMRCTGRSPSPPSKQGSTSSVRSRWL